MPMALGHCKTCASDLRLALLVGVIEQFHQGAPLAALAAEHVSSSYQHVHR
jgi:hypothetical protein